MKRINVILAALTLLGLMTGCGGGSNTNTSAGTPGITFTFNHSVKEWKSDGKNEETIYLGGSGTASIDWGDGSPVETVTLSSITWKYFENFWYCETENAEIKHSYLQAAEYCVKISGEDITTFNCRELNVESLTINISTLKELDCSRNKLTTLDLRKFPALERLNCGENPLETLDVSKNKALKLLCCNENKLTTLDLSANTSLEWLNCSENHELKSLDVSKNKNICYIRCRMTGLSEEGLNALFQTLPFRDGGDEGWIDIMYNDGDDTCDRSIAEKKGWDVYVNYDEAG